MSSMYKSKKSKKAKEAKRRPQASASSGGSGSETAYERSRDRTSHKTIKMTLKHHLLKYKLEIL